MSAMEHRPFSPSLLLRVDAFAGTDIEDASRDLCALSERVGARCALDFNGVTLWARPGDDPAKLAEAFHMELSSDRSYKIAQVKP